MKKNGKLQIALASTLASLTLISCGEKSDCEIPTRHVHRYTREITEDITIERYIDNEHLTVGKYNWNDNYIEITKDDEELYKIIGKNGLFVGTDNWDYLYYRMANSHDYLEFYYRYETVVPVTTIDDKGNPHTELKTEVHTGWHEDPNSGNNTGRVRLNHHRFYGYRITYKNGKYRLEKSNQVDDIRDIMDDYPYFNEDCSTIVYEEFYFDKKELPYLSPEDFDVFTGPNLENKDKVKILN